MHILLISGSTRARSTNTAALRTVRDVAPEDITTTVYDGSTRLPAFNPDDDQEPLHPAVADLRAQIGKADAVLICTPEYAGALPGSFKNLLDWTVGGSEMYGKPVAWINVAAAGRGMNAHSSLKIVLGYLSVSLIEPACQDIPVPHDAVSAGGVVEDTGIRDQLAKVVQAIRNHINHVA